MVRKLIMPLVVCMLFGVCSCKKTWLCKCTQGGPAVTISNTYKGEAASQCAIIQVQVQDTIQQAACSL